MLCRASIGLISFFRFAIARECLEKILIADYMIIELLVKLKAMVLFIAFVVFFARANW